jgi:hypothetical protein
MTAPALAAPAMATPALAALGVWATDEVSAIGLYGCTNRSPPSPWAGCAIKQGMAFRINQQFVGSQKIHAQNRKSYVHLPIEISKKNPDPGIKAASGSLPSRV